jgi:hypothetical protein
VATKAERFRAEQQRKGGKLKTKTDTRPKPANKNESGFAGRKASFALEEGASRKSTRKSANRSKPDNQLKRRETRRITSPKRRARASKS